MSNPAAFPVEGGMLGDFEEFDEFDLTPEELAAAELNRLVDQLTAARREEAAAAAHRYRVIDAFRQEWEASPTVSGAALPGMRARAMRAELASALALSERTVESLVGIARALLHDLPTTFAALSRGLISDRHARIIVDESAGLSPEERTVFEAEALPHAQELTAAKFTRTARTLREHLRTADLAARHATAREHRAVTLIPQRDGMADLLMHLPAEQAVAIYSRADRIARTLPTRDSSEGVGVGEGDERTLMQKRVDVLADLLLDDGALLPTEHTEHTDTSNDRGGNSGERGGNSTVDPRTPTLHRGIRPEVHVTVPVLTLAGVEETPASLDGYGPISPQTARGLVGAASGFYRVLTHPETGVTLSFGREKYEIPAELRRYLRARDETCRFVGCTRPAAATELDHTIAWDDGGTTTASNLGCLCKGHHRLKHNTAWTVRQPPDRTADYTWTSPLGHHYRTRPALQIGAGVRAQDRWLDDTPPPF